MTRPLFSFPQPHISSYSGEVMPLLLTYLKSVPSGHTHHLAKACYALENFVENLGSDGIWGCEGGDGPVVLPQAAGCVSC